MSKGKRYDEPKLNMKKVFGTIITIVVIIMIIITINKILSKKANEIVNEKVTYFSAYVDEKWGVINNNGEIVIDTTYDEMVTIPNPDKAVFVCIYDVNEQTGVCKTKAIDDTGKAIFTEYDTIEVIDNFDSKQNNWFENNLLRVSKNGKYGIIDCDGNHILECEYDEINSLKSVEGNLIVKKDGKVGLVNNVGQQIIETKYNDIKTLKEGYKNEYIIIDENGNSGVISTSGTIIIEPAYKEIKFLNSTDYYSVKINDKWQLINKKGEIVNNSYDEYTFVKGDYVIVRKDQKYGIITIDGQVKIEPTYEELNYAFSVYYIAKQNSKYGIINTENVSIIPLEYLSMNYWEEKEILIADRTISETVLFDSNLTEKLAGIFVYENDYIKARVNSEDKYYTYRFEEKQTKDILTKNTLFVSKDPETGKYGYVDSQGNLVVEYSYDDAKEQNKYGYAAVKVNGMWGSLDKGGKQALPTVVNLENSIYVDFIREWHLADEGIYYTK